MKPESQNKMILADLMTGVRITSLDAIKNYGTVRLSGRIFDLRQEGFNIKDTWLEVKTKYGVKRVKQYFLK